MPAENCFPGANGVFSATCTSKTCTRKVRWLIISNYSISWDEEMCSIPATMFALEQVEMVRCALSSSGCCICNRSLE